MKNCFSSFQYFSSCINYAISSNMKTSSSPGIGILLANKADLQSQISPDTSQNISTLTKFPLFFVSGKIGTNLEKAVLFLIEELIEACDAQVPPPSSIQKPVVSKSRSIERVERKLVKNKTPPSLSSEFKKIQRRPKDE